MKAGRIVLVAVVLGALLLPGCSQDAELVEPLLFGEEEDARADSTAIDPDASETSPAAEM